MFFNLNLMILIISTVSSSLISMVSQNKQLLCCIARREYDKQYHTITKHQTNPVCPFCDPQKLSENFILKEDKNTNVRRIPNKFPYPDWKQADHLLIMPISHQTHPCDFSSEIATEVQIISAQLHANSCKQVRWINWGKKFSGQSVDHIHEQFINYITSPLSVTEGIELRKNFSTITAQEAFEVIKQKLEGDVVIVPKPACSNSSCLCCRLRDKKTTEDDQKNLIFFRGKHNFIGLSQYPSFSAEVSVVPYNHVSAIKDLSQQAWQENAILAKALLPKLQVYAATHIRECDGGNICTISLGAKASEKKQAVHHLHTVVLPRTSIQPTPDAMMGHSCIYMGDPEHLYDYLLSFKEEFQSLINKEE